MDDKWDQVMALALEAGFITSAYDGTAILMTHDTQKKLLGEDEYRRIQKMSGVE